MTVTRRLGSTPKDRWGVTVWLAMEDVLRQIVVEVAGLNRYQVLRVANETYLHLTSPWPGGIIEPLRFRDGGRPEPKDPEWFSATELATGKVANAGVAQTLTFGGARRCQVNDANEG